MKLTLYEGFEQANIHFVQIHNFDLWCAMNYESLTGAVMKTQPQRMNGQASHSSVAH